MSWELLRCEALFCQLAKGLYKSSCELVSEGGESTREGECLCCWPLFIGGLEAGAGSVESRRPGKTLTAEFKPRQDVYEQDKVTDCTHKLTCIYYGTPRPSAG